MSARPLNPPFHQTNPNGRFWAKTDELAKLPADLMPKMAASMAAPDGDWIEHQGYFYRAEKSKDGKSVFFVQKTKEEIEADKNRPAGGFKKGMGGRPLLLYAEDFTVATVDTEVKKLLKDGWAFIVGEHGVQVGTMAMASQTGQGPDVVNGIFMVKKKQEA